MIIKKTVTLYHATRSEHLEKILKEGLRVSPKEVGRERENTVMVCQKGALHEDLEGHGAKSVRIIEEFGGIKLTEPERNAIRYHMGPTNQHDPLTIPLDELKRIVRSSQLVGIIQTADNLSSIYSKDIS